MFNSTLLNKLRLSFLRNTLVHGIIIEIVKHGMENKLDQNMQPVTVGSMHSTKELCKSLGIAKILI